MTWGSISFVLKSRQRLILLRLLENPKTPTQIACIMHSSLANISLKLADLSKKGLIECVNPEDLKGRIYRMTHRGKQVLKKIAEMEK